MVRHGTILALLTAGSQHEIGRQRVAFKRHRVAREVEDASSGHGLEDALTGSRIANQSGATRIERLEIAHLVLGSGELR